MDNPGAGGQQPPGAVVVNMEAAAAAAAAGPAWTRLSKRLAWSAALFLLGCAAAGLALFAMVLLPPADSGRFLRGKAWALTTDAEAARMRAASEYLLLAASAQVLAATMGLLVPAWPFAFLGCATGCLTAYRAADVLVWVIVACHGGGSTVHGALAFHLLLFLLALCAVLVVGAVVSMRCR